MAIAKLALSAEWPAWSKKQARAARLVCGQRCNDGVDEMTRLTRARRKAVVTTVEKKGRATRVAATIWSGA
ncbi:hypothetical protein [Streptomyces sp. NPDC054975]